MKVVQGPLKPLEVGQYHHRQPKFVLIRHVKNCLYQIMVDKNIVHVNAQKECINIKLKF